MHREYAEAKIVDLLTTAIDGSCDGSDALADPGYGVWCMLVDCVIMFAEFHKREPVEIYLTDRLAALLNDFFQKEGGKISLERRTTISRSKVNLLGKTVFVGASHFKLK